MGRSLSVFDFDDTIAVSHGHIEVVKPDGTSRRFTSEEYVHYPPMSGDVLHFSNLNDLHNPRLVLSVWEDFVSDVHNPDVDVVILTSRPRGASSAIKKLLFHMGIPSQCVEVLAIASGKPQDKANRIEEKILTGLYTYIRFVDDNHKNVAAVKGTLENHNIHGESILLPHADLTSGNLGAICGEHFPSDEWEECVFYVP